MARRRRARDHQAPHSRTEESLLMSTQDAVLPEYLGEGDPALKDYFPVWVNDIADDATLEGSMINGVVVGAEDIRSVVLTIRSLYEHQEFMAAGPFGNGGAFERYAAKVKNGEPVGCVVLVTRNAAGQTQHVVASYRPYNALVIFARILRKTFAGTPLAGSFGASE
jgi:hypothetical protein